jgi:hypothetical protein
MEKKKEKANIEDNREGQHGEKNEVSRNCK